MKSNKLCTAAVLVLLTATAAEAARPKASPGIPPHLFTMDQTARVTAASRSEAGRPVKDLESLPLLADAVEEIAIQTDPAAVAANPPVFTVELPDLPLLEAVRSRFVEHGPDWKSWFGTLRHAGSDEPGSGYVHLGYHGDQVTALFHFEGQIFRIVGGGKGVQRLARISEDLSPPSCAVKDSAAGALPPALSEDGDEAAAPAAVSAAPDAITTTHTLDLLAVYPRAFFGQGPTAETAMFNFIRDSVAIANDAFVRSNIPAAYNLVGIVPILDTLSQPSAGLTASRTWLESQPTEIVNLRAAYGVDIVTLFIPWAWNAQPNCGIAVLPDSTTGAMTDRAFSVNRDGCGISDFTLGHEIGHNYGMRHDEENPPPVNPPLYVNGRGYILTLNNRHQATVMGCFCTGCACSGTCPLGSGAVCNRIPHFSDPAINYNGVPTGTMNRNNAQVGRTQVPIYAGFRTLVANTPPTANFTVSCVGRTCSFNATSSTDNSGITSYAWDFGDGTTATGSIVSHPFPATGVSFPVHLVVTDNGANGGQKGVKAMIVEPQPAALYEGFHELANCTTISGWAWDQNQPNTPINVGLDRDGINIASVPANLHRLDLQNAGKGNGIHAFVYPVDHSWKDGVAHSVRVRHNTTGVNLSWSPRTILCGVTALTNLAPLNNGPTGGTPFTVGTQFSSSVNGTITHIGFYRALGESGTNTGRLWTDAGVQLASGAFTSSASIPSGWVWRALTTPIAITAGTLYRVSVNTNVQQAKTNCGFPMGGITNQYLTAHQGVWIAGSGTGVFPNTGSCSNFFVDVKFDPN